MEKQSNSFWTDIKRFEDALASDPESYCFAPLAELYRKVGMVDEAINVARRGIEIHPEYVGGYMALGRACHENGMVEEGRQALERVVRVTPDNIMAQRILSQIYLDAGESNRARKALDVIISLHPDDYESRVMRDAILEPAKSSIEPDFEPFATEAQEKIAEDLQAQIDDGPSDQVSMEGEEAEILEDLEIIEDAEIFEEVEEAEAETVSGPEAVTVCSMKVETEGMEGPAVSVEQEPVIVAKPGARDPLSTITLAELYTNQGFFSRALNIYQALLDADPDNEDIKRRIAGLQQRMAPQEPAAAEVSEAPEVPGAAMPSAPEMPDTEFMPELSPPLQADREEIAVSDQNARIIGELEGWLDSIRRVRECRSETH